MCHGLVNTGTMPMMLIGFNYDHIARSDFRGSHPATPHQADTFCNYQCLTKRMAVPKSSRAWSEGYASDCEVVSLSWEFEISHKRDPGKPLGWTYDRLGLRL
jgi:hypothetical protein